MSFSTSSLAIHKQGTVITILERIHERLHEKIESIILVMV